jgi:hypothetical protein
MNGVVAGRIHAVPWLTRGNPAAFYRKSLYDDRHSAPGSRIPNFLLDEQELAVAEGCGRIP